LIGKLTAGDPATLARCISLMESADPAAGAVHQRICPLTGRATVIGFTGAPGAGKSTLIDAYIGALRARGQRIAVAAVDPSSPISDGAILGDRVRMLRHAEDVGVFIRSIASRGHLGGLSESIHRIVDAMDAAGFDVIIVETVGTGQSEVEVAQLADVCVVVNAPNMGDDVQAMKAGVLEIADVLVVNKADLGHAQSTTKNLRSMLKLRRDNRDVAVVETIATKDNGIERLVEAIDARLALGIADRQKRRERRVRRLIAAAASRAVHGFIRDATSGEIESIIKAASVGEIDVPTAVERALSARTPNTRES
jgi:LAO/AO transport system kinase